MPRRATAKDVARLSGVSSATVSYVLNNAPGQSIPETTRERVRAAAAKLAYVPSAAAASLRRGHSRTVLVVTERALSGWVTEPFLQSISDRLVEEELVPIVYSMISEKGLLALVGEIRPYGVIAPLMVSPALVSGLESQGVPHIYVSGRSDMEFRRPWEAKIGAAQARHLLACGAGGLVYANPPTDNPRILMAHSRESGARNEIAESSSMRFNAVSVPRDLDQAVAILADVLGRHCQTPVGICAFDDDVAAVVVAAIKRLGLRIPSNVMVVGVDDNPFSAYLEPPLTTVAIDARVSGQALTERFLGTATDSSGSSSEASAIQVRVVARSTT